MPSRPTIYSLFQLFSPNDPLQLPIFENLVDQLPAPYILLGYFNARSPLWGDIITNAKGRVIETFLTHHDSALLNRDTPTHFHLQNGSFTCIDLSLCSADIAGVFEWSVSDDLFDSDHFPIFLRLPDISPRLTRSRLMLEKANWTEFSELAICDRDVCSFQSVDAALS